MHSVERRRKPRLEDLRTHRRTASRAAAAGAIRMGRTFGAALTLRREVGAAEAYNLFWSSLIFLSFGLLAFKWPKAIAMPFAVLAVWFALAGLFRAWRLYRTPISEPAPISEQAPISDPKERTITESKSA